MTRVVHPYDSGWVERFRVERDRLGPVLGRWLAPEGIEHVGSTAVPGMPAKPVIDVVAAVRSLTGARGAIGPLAALGYAHAPHRGDALWFFAPGTARTTGEHTHHLHLTEPGSPLWSERLAFRDWLRADPGLRAEYAVLKRELLLAAGGVEYTGAAKREFVARVLEQAGIRLAPG